MAQPASASRAQIAPDVDPARLFQEAEARLSETLDILQIVAASRERALFLVRDKVLKRRAALRIQLTPDTPARRWFECETELLAALDHPILRPIYSAGYVREWAYRLAKWVDGEALLDAVRRGPRPIPTVLQLARDLTSLFEYVHAQHIVIRQLIPATILVETGERNVVTDLRYATICLHVAQPSHEPDALPFVAPEIRDGGAAEPTSDIYTTGALLNFAVTGQAPPLEAEGMPAPRDLRPACPKALERIILRALDRDPQARYQTAAEMADDLLSDLGEFDVRFSAPPSAHIAEEDSRAWEKRLRRALGDDYELLDELGAGGFGRVYRVRDLSLERFVALKVLHPYLTADPNVVERFRREAQLAAQLHHPNIVEIFNIGGRAGLLWYTMAFVPGTNLTKVVQDQGPLPVERVVGILENALAALQHAHARGLVHRDLKPENLLIEAETGRVRIADFGLALAFKGDDRQGGASSSRSGTPEFAAPEQLLGEKVDRRADLYSLTLAAYFALTGRSPFEGGTIESIVARQAVGLLPDVLALRDDVPQKLIHVLAQGAARAPEDRFRSAEEYAHALRAATRSRGASLKRLMGRAFRR